MSGAGTSVGDEARDVPVHARILVVEDDTKTAELVALYLRHAGHSIEIEHAGDRGFSRTLQREYDLLILDVMLPGMDGIELCRRVRERSRTPIIMLTARTLEEQRVEGLDCGADDYITKPFSPRELVARVASLLRRVPPGAADMLRGGDVLLDRARRCVTVVDRLVELTPTEFNLLESLMERPGHVRTRAQLLQLLPASAGNALDRTVDVHIRNLRRKIERNPDEPVHLQTVLGSGYRFGDPLGRVNV